MYSLFSWYTYLYLSEKTILIHSCEVRAKKLIKQPPGKKEAFPFAGLTITFQSFVTFTLFWFKWEKILT